jgi:predicted transcriptional regulator
MATLSAMNKRLAAAINRLQRLPEERQQDAASVLEAFIAQDALRPAWTAEQLEEIRAGIAEAAQGEFVTDEEVEALFARFRG